MQEKSLNNINTWQNLNDEDFIHIARYLRQDFTTQLDRDYVAARLKTLGYEITYGCCGSNKLRMFKYE